jgi:hypothetical protein
MAADERLSAERLFAGIPGRLKMAVGIFSAPFDGLTKSGRIPDPSSEND